MDFLASPQVQSAIISGLVAIILLLLGKWLDMLNKDRAAVKRQKRVSLSPEAQKSWEGAYMELTDKYLVLEEEVADIRRDLDSLASSVRAEPYDTAQRIFARAKAVTGALSDDSKSYIDSPLSSPLPPIPKP